MAHVNYSLRPKLYILKCRCRDGIGTKGRWIAWKSIGYYSEKSQALAVFNKCIINPVVEHAVFHDGKRLKARDVLDVETRSPDSVGPGEVLCGAWRAT
jgi:hypothetical protein